MTSYCAPPERGPYSEHVVPVDVVVACFYRSTHQQSVQRGSSGDASPCVAMNYVHVMRLGFFNEVKLSDL